MAFDRNAAEIHALGNAADFERVYCKYPSQRLLITSNGNYLPCCVDYNETMVLGNIKNKSISGIWNGNVMKTLRETLKNGEFMSKTCENCTSWMAYKSKGRDMVGDTWIRKTQ